MTIKIKFYHMINIEWFACIFQKAVKKREFFDSLSLHRVTLEVQWSSNRALHGSRLALWVSVVVVLILITPVCTPECQTIRTGSLSMSGGIMRVSSLLPPLLLCRMRMWLVLRKVCFLTSPWQRKIQLSITETVIQHAHCNFNLPLLLSRFSLQRQCVEVLQGYGHGWLV